MYKDDNLIFFKGPNVCMQEKIKVSSISQR